MSNVCDFFGDGSGVALVEFEDSIINKMVFNQYNDITKLKITGLPYAKVIYDDI